KLWLRFYQQDPPTTLLSELHDYLENKGVYKSFPQYVASLKADTTGKTEFSDPLFMFNGVRFAGQPLSPLQKIAHRILSICANSASCERLFSNFGTILTKLRSRLGLQNMLNLAELRLHLRDEYMCKTGTQERLKRKRRLASTTSIPTAATTSTSTNTATSQSESAAAQLLSSVPSTNQSAHQTTCNEAAAVADASAFEIDGEDSLSAISQALQERATLDDAGGNNDFTPVLEKIKLEQLFNFSDIAWAEIIQKMTMKSLDEELELYELVDMDAEGEVDDIDVANDPMFSC
ncbi:hypothetical protein PAXRUDRAFT_422094, partial [Paxillus rubicundulus Ve08.2h10]